jgi:hypothetical protein
MKIFMNKPGVGTVDINVSSSIVQQAFTKGKSTFKKIAKRQPHPCDGCGAANIVDFFINHDDYESHSELKLYSIALIYMLKATGYQISPTTKTITIDLQKIAQKYGFNVGPPKQAEESVELYVIKHDEMCLIEIPLDMNAALRDFEYVYNKLEHPCLGCMSNHLLDYFDDIANKTDSEAKTFASAAIIMEKFRLENSPEHSLGSGDIDVSLSIIKTVDLVEINEFALEFVNR